MLFIVIIYFVCWGRGGGRETIPPSTANKIIPRKKFKLLQISKVNLLNLG